MFDVQVTKAADEDIDGIVDYIAVKLANPSAATAFVEKVQTCYNALKQTPMMFPKCLNPRLQRLGYRKALVSNYILIYKVETNTQRIYVLRVFYGGQDYVRKL